MVLCYRPSRRATLPKALFQPSGANSQCAKALIHESRHEDHGLGVMHPVGGARVRLVMACAPKEGGGVSLYPSIKGKRPRIFSIVLATTITLVLTNERFQYSHRRAHQTKMQSRFQEGAQADITTSAHFFTILSEMDEHERKKRAHRGSNSSFGSFSSFDEKDFTPKEGRRSIAFGVSPGAGEASRGRSFDVPREATSLDSVVKGFKGRLRALTIGGKTGT